MFRTFSLSAIAVVSILSTNNATASDARSIALGGAVIANGKGVHGAISNPASMMAMQRRGESIHFRLGGATEIRDTGGLIDEASDENNEDLISDIDEQIDELSNQNVTCNPLTDDSNTACISGTQELFDLTNRVLDLMEIADEQSLEGRINADFGMAFTHTSYPVAVNLRVSGAGSGSPDIADNDFDYINELLEFLDDDEITLQELGVDIDFSDPDAIIQLVEDQLNVPLNIALPEDELQSEATGGVLIRTQLGVSFATTLSVSGQKIDIGVTPKFSSLTAGGINISAAEEFGDEVESAEDRFEDSEVTESSFTLDLGASMTLPETSIQVAGVIRNLISESITTNEGFEFETTPQLILGTAYHLDKLSITGEIALNEAEIDSFPTQKIGVGVEYGTRLLAIRGGVAIDAAKEDDKAALTLGFGLGALDIGGRLSGLESLEVGAQVAFSFQ